MGAIAALAGKALRVAWLALLAFIVCSETSLLAMEAAGFASTYSETGVAADGPAHEYRPLKPCESYHTDFYFLGIHDCPSKPALTHALSAMQFGRAVIGLPAATLTEYIIRPLNAFWLYSGLTLILATTALLFRGIYANLGDNQSSWPKTIHRICLHALLVLAAIMIYRLTAA